MKKRSFILYNLILCSAILRIVSASEIVCPECDKDLLRILQNESGRIGDSLEVRLTKILHDRGYLDISITHDSEETRITPGQQATLQTIHIAGADSTHFNINRPFTKVNVDRAINEILNGYSQRGFYYAAVEIIDVTRNDSMIDLTVKLTSGPKVKVAGTEYIGLIKTDPQLIDRMLDLPDTTTLTDRLIQETESTASAIPFLKFQPPVLVKPRAGYTESDLQLTFTERRQFYFEGAIGYLPQDNSNLVWSLDMTLRNLFGGGREARLRSERREKDRNELQIQYTQPAFLIGIDRLSASIATRDYRESFYEFSAQASYTARLSHTSTLSLGLEWKSVEPETNLPGFNRYGITLGGGSNTLDSRTNPSRGFRIEGALSYLNRRYDTDTTKLQPESRVLNETRAELQLEKFTSFGVGPVWRTFVGYQGLETSESLPPLSELTLIGGPGTLRGYRNEQFAVIRAAYATLEPRFRFNSGYAFLFIDAAYLNNRIENNGNIVADEFYRYGYGLGLALVARERAVELSLGWSEEADIDQPRLSIRFSSDI